MRWEWVSDKKDTSEDFMWHENNLRIESNGSTLDVHILECRVESVVQCIVATTKIVVKMTPLVSFIHLSNGLLFDFSLFASPNMNSITFSFGLPELGLGCSVAQSCTRRANVLLLLSPINHRYHEYAIFEPSWWTWNNRCDKQWYTVNNALCENNSNEIACKIISY